MDKKLLIQVFVVIVVLGFILNYFYMGGGFGRFSLFSGGDDEGMNQTGTAVINGTIRTYDPLLLLPSDTAQSVIDELNIRGGVSSVQPQTDGSFLVQTDTRDDVYPLALYLKEKGITSVARANIAVPQTVEVEINGKKKDVRSAYTIIIVVTEPIVDAGSPVSVGLTAIVNDDYLVGYYNAALLLQEENIAVDAVIKALDYKQYRYVIPWQNRTSVNLSEYEYADYTRKDIIVFNPQLDLNQIMVKKQFPYVEYIDAGSATLSKDFDNLTKLQSNFQDVSYTLPDSVLIIRTNETPDLAFDAEVTYVYLLELQGTDYAFPEPVLAISFDEEQEVNDTVALNMTVLSVEKNVVSISSVSPS